jgi:hypothetical protein
MADFLWSKQIDRKKLKPFLLEQAERIKKHAGVMARRWRVSLPGRRVMAAALKLREVAYPALYAEAA